LIVKSDCVFCAIAEGDAPAEVIYEDGGFQSVFHFHFHIVPRWKDDGLIRPWEPKRGEEEEIRETARLIREQLS